MERPFNCLSKGIWQASVCSPAVPDVRYSARVQIFDPFAACLCTTTTNTEKPERTYSLFCSIGLPPASDTNLEAGSTRSPSP